MNRTLSPPINFIFLLTWIIFVAYSCQNPAPLPHPDQDNGGLSLPGGFGALVVVDSIGKGRHLAVNENGDIYVKLRYAREVGSNVALRDTTGDGKADIISYFGEYEDEGSLANGMRIHDGYLYYSAARVVYRNRLVPGQLIPDSPMEVVLTDDHEHGIHWHITKPVSFDMEGNMYVPFGSPSNACQDLVNKPGGIPGSEGLDPCPELIEHGGIWKFPKDKLGMTQKDGELYATGIRSVVAMDFNQQDNHLYLVMHGRDNLHLLYPETFTPWESAVLPSEEFIKVTQGADYGWPYCYYDQIQRKKVLAPEYGGDGKIIGRCGDMDDPAMGFPGHWAPNDLLFYKGDQFPERYKGGAFVAFHGSTNRAPYPQSGYFVAFVPFENGQPTGDWEVFANGFAGTNPIVNVSDAEFRPMGLAEGPDGSLYISDSNKGRIWRVLFTGDKNSFGEESLAAMEAQKQLANIRNPHPEQDNLYRGKQPQGNQVYTTYCAPCHQRDGKGAAGRIPGLHQTEWVSGDKERLIRIVLQGLDGEIEVNGERYDNVMPAHGFLDDQQIASVLTYLRQNFENQASPVMPEEVASLRTNSQEQ
ncbi:c-type cytochrome [Cyclobacterium jeungdonense]|uniref:PQQ-dependent sugar dehydrogenase n=1 Tax=Cyclobacterium jeungdonense TaxID=708087 RepID=A0ABT8C5N4_9BACT|nr:c-type cytochrome [Cyclobacterium jeungdonense]MDN3687785.1 PQQ-dependent sugar dehydrogenase [Cyclobacterium jeungdonense]